MKEKNATTSPATRLSQSDRWPAAEMSGACVKVPPIWLSKIERLYLNVPARWSRHVYSDTVVTRLVKAAHGDASGVRGAARLW